MALLPLSDDTFLFFIAAGIFYCLYVELKLENPVKKVRRQRKPLDRKYAPITVAPIYCGSAVRTPLHLDLFSLFRFIPANAVLSNAENERTENTIKRVARTASVTVSQTESEQTTPVVDSQQQMEMCKRIIFPFPPGCEPDGANAQTLAKKYASLTRPDIVRFLVARKGVLSAAEEMIDKCLAWRSLHFPLTRKQIQTALKTKCFFPYGNAKDGSPIVYMRGGLYDAALATPEEYVLAAAYVIEYALQQSPTQTNVTVLVHTFTVPGGPNQSADTNFIKLFIQVLSDNYPERLKRLVIFPFPWYGRAIWGMLKVFVDRRTQDKVMLLSQEKPKEIQDIVDVNEMPSFIGGTCKAPIADLVSTLET